MDNTRTDDLIRRNHELLAAAAQAWSAFMETVARIDHARERRSGRFVRFGTASGRPDAGEGRGCYLDNRRSVLAHRPTTPDRMRSGWSG
jgi:hypothetical protein